MIIIKSNQFFLTNKIINIMYMKKLHNFLKQVSIDR